MNIERAKEILGSSEEIEVQMSGEPVWIETVDEKSRSVKIHSLRNAHDHRIVASEQLQEV